jgi:uncharacterized membrane protein
MDLFNLFSPAGHFIAPYIRDISLALITCTLVILGGDINRFIRQLLRNQHFVIRTFAFILLNAFGYGLLIVNASPYLARTLMRLESGMMFAVVIFSFVVIGLWAQKNRHV